MWFTSRRREVEKLLEAYRGAVAQCAAEFRGAMERFCGSGDRTQLELDLTAVHREEHRADDLRREIEVLMYSRALFPESRGDILGLLETMDKVPNHMEESLRMIVNEAIVAPADFRGDLWRLGETAVRCAHVMLDAAEKVLSHLPSAAALVGNIDEIESEADHHEAALIRRIFSSDLKDLDKLQLSALVKSISSICDKAETTGDRIRLMAAKRTV